MMTHQQIQMKNSRTYSREITSFCIKPSFDDEQLLTNIESVKKLKIDLKKIIYIFNNLIVKRNLINVNLIKV